MKTILIFKKRFFFILLLILLISQSITEIISKDTIKIYSEDYFTVNCDSHFFYLSMNISTTKKVEEIINFDLTLLNPPELKLKCIINTNDEKLICFSFVPRGQNYQREDLFFHLFYIPPKVPN